MTFFPTSSLQKHEAGGWEAAVWHQERTSAGLCSDLFCTYVCGYHAYAYTGSAGGQSVVGTICMNVDTMCVLTCGHAGGWTVAVTIMCLHMGTPEEAGSRIQMQPHDPQGLRVCSA